MKYLNVGVEGLSQVADEIIKIGNELPVWTFVGNLGAGKTTLIKILANKLHIQDSISSPTFSYVNEYDGKVFHFDCYRLRSLEEALDFGIEEYLDSGKKCWIEWPQIVEPILPTPYLEINIEHNENISRNIYLKIIK
ncbi:MAG: tRNA (adenosine(37)-N6)-threonylcarbamoyltransferase complex ATPase subunit type 1 TsaE [Cytophagaceae bacterium BCCC1]|nr:MAG: tRNA (adenosine(37)-N6)-threonylcarbamoyltransferase complex ATPase subunit type 1 TsaE [Cytophagaceae bacterium BCCC1]